MVRPIGGPILMTPRSAAARAPPDPAAARAARSLHPGHVPHRGDDLRASSTWRLAPGDAALARAQAFGISLASPRWSWSASPGRYGAPGSMAILVFSVCYVRHRDATASSATAASIRPPPCSSSAPRSPPAPSSRGASRPAGHRRRRGRLTARRRDPRTTAASRAVARDPAAAVVIAFLLSLLAARE